MIKQIFSSQNIKTYFHTKIDQDRNMNLSTIKMEQTHSANIHEITTPAHLTVLNTDAIFTQLPNVQLNVKHADCLPILIYHPKPLIAAIHAGRKSTELQITNKLLLHLKNNFDIQDSLELWFGPAICNDCYQIDREKDLHYDLIAQNIEQVRQVFSENQAKIIYSNHCTAHDNDQFYSYRKEGKGVPMNWSGISISIYQT